MNKTKTSTNGKKKNKRRLQILLIPAAVLFVSAILVVAVLRPDWRFRCEEKIRHWTSNAKIEEIKEQDLNLIPTDLATLKADPKVQWNQSLLLINQANPIPSGFQAEVEEYNDSGVWMNHCITEAYQQLAADIKEKFGQKLYIKSAYRTDMQQAAEYQTDSETAAMVGSSEHQAGLALDVNVKNFGGQAFLKTETGRFVNRNCSDYGFIIRYPQGKKDVTGIGYEPWHIRYVGIPHAEIIDQKNWTLEEYYQHLEAGKYYQYKDYLITRQSQDSIKIPQAYAKITISPDNQGCYLLTIRP